MALTKKIELKKNALGRLVPAPPAAVRALVSALYDPTFEVQVEVTEALFNGWMDDLRAFEKQVTEKLRSALLVRPKVRLVEPGKLERTEGKARRVIDSRPR